MVIKMPSLHHIILQRNLFVAFMYNLKKLRHIICANIEAYLHAGCTYISVYIFIYLDILVTTEVKGCEKVIFFTSILI